MKKFKALREWFRSNRLNCEIMKFEINSQGRYDVPRQGKVRGWTLYRQRGIRPGTRGSVLIRFSLDHEIICDFDIAELETILDWVRHYKKPELLIEKERLL